MQDWIKKAVLIWCPAPLPEGPATDLLTRMLIPTPYHVAASGETEILLPKGRSAEGAFQGKKRVATEDQEGKPSKRGKTSSSSGLGRASEAVVDLDDEDEPRGKP